MKDTLKQYVTLRSGLIAERAGLEARLREINQALGDSSSASPVAASGEAVGAQTKRRGRPPGSGKAVSASAVGPGRGRGRGRGRSIDGSSLKEAAVAALQGGKSLRRQELLKAVVDGGYQFTAKDPLNSLSTLVYSSKKVFKAKRGMISLA